MNARGGRDNPRAGDPTFKGYHWVPSSPACDWCKSKRGRYKIDDLVRTQFKAIRRHKKCNCNVEPWFDDKEQVRLAELQNVADRYGVTVDQLKSAKSTVKDIRQDIKSLAAAEADELDYVLTSQTLDKLTRPKRLKKSTSSAGRTAYRRESSGYDWLETLQPDELARVRHRMTKSTVYTPDVMVERVTKATGQEFASADDAMEYVTQQWLRQDGLRSVASGRNPTYVDIDNLLPNEYEMQGFRLSEIFGVDADDAAGHVAQVLNDQAQDYAERALGRRATLGPDPYLMDSFDYVQEVDDLTAFVFEAETEAGLINPAGVQQAKDRLRELLPEAVDNGRMNLYELHDEIRVTAIRAGRL